MSQEQGTDSESSAAAEGSPIGQEGDSPLLGVDESSSWTGLAATFRSLRHRDYRLYFFGQLISLTGTWMQTTALTWLAFDLTGQSLWPALVNVAQILPTAFLGVWGGGLADRWPKRHLILITQAIYTLLAFLLAGLAFGEHITPWQLFVVTLAGGLVQAVDVPARMAFVMDMTSREDLINAVALNSLLFNVARAVGPAVAGYLLLTLKPWGCFLANGLSYLAVLWALAAMNVSGKPRLKAIHKDDQSLLAGFRFVLGHKQLAFAILLAGTTSFCGWPFLSLLPALANDVLKSQQHGYGLLLSGTGAGALLAAWTVATFGTKDNRRLMIIAGVGTVAAALVGLGLAGNLILAVIGCSAVGYGLIMFLSTTQSFLQMSAGDHNRGRIMGIWVMVLSAAVPLGNLLAGPAADQLGVPVVLCASGALCGTFALGLLACFNKVRGNGSAGTAGQGKRL